MAAKHDHKNENERFRHVNRRDETEIIRAVGETKKEGKRPRGRLGCDRRTLSELT